MLTQPVRVGEGGSATDVVSVELIREGTVTREIQVRCPCGQKIVLECEYPIDAQDK